MDAILFSANPNMVVVDDAVRHLADHDELYWEVGFPVAKKTADSFSFPIYGYMHISGGQVEYRVTIKDIAPFTNQHYENEALSVSVKPEPWIREWKENVNDVQSYGWKTILIMTRIDPYSRNTYELQKLDGSFITNPPQKYVRILDPGGSAGLAQGQNRQITRPITSNSSTSILAERNLEDFVIDRLDSIESGLRLIGRQLSTEAGRLDLLCKDSEGNYVVVELKRDQGTDRVVGQILRYMGWVIIHHKTSNVRGIIIVGKKDSALNFAVKAAPKIEVKEFHLSIR